MREELQASLGPIELSDLRPHLVRDAVIVVDPSLDLLDVGEAVARDDKAKVGAWITASLLGKPSLEQLAAWEGANAPSLLAIVVQPFVLVQEGPRAVSPLS